MGRWGGGEVNVKKLLETCTRFFTVRDYNLISGFCWLGVIIQKDVCDAGLD